METEPTVITKIYFVIYHRNTMEYGHYQTVRIEAASKPLAAEQAAEFYEQHFEDPIIVDGVVPKAEWKVY